MDSQGPLEACWKIDTNNEACYIDVIPDDDSDDVHAREYSSWCDLPDLLLEQVFSYLTIKERYYASLVCLNWYRAFHLPRVWSNFLVEDQTLTRSKFNYYSGWQYVLDHLRAQNCLTRVGHYIRGFDFRPIHSFSNMFQFMTLISWCMEQNRNGDCSSDLLGIGSHIQSLNYIFPCNMAVTHDPDGIHLFGTGGQLLAALKRLMSNLTDLKILKLNDLILERYEAKHLLDEVLQSCSFVLEKLTLVNVTLTHCPIMHVGLFFNLRILIISPQNLDDDVLQLLGDSKIQHLHLLQNRYTPASIAITACSPKGWRLLRRDNPNLLVHLRVESTNNGEVLLQPEAPVASIRYRTPETQMKSSKVLEILDLYKSTLSIYGYETLPRFSSPKSFSSRIDSLLVLMARACPQLRFLIIREKISTSTILLLASTMPNLKYLYVRRNAVILRCDWPKNPEWSPEFHEWLKLSSRSYDATEREVSQILGQRWTMLSDKVFKRLTVNVETN